MWGKSTANRYGFSGSHGLRVSEARHSTGYALAGRGVDTRRLQHYLGHASITNTVRYAAISPEPFKDIWR